MPKSKECMVWITGVVTRKNNDSLFNNNQQQRKNLGICSRREKTWRDGSGLRSYTPSISPSMQCSLKNARLKRVVSDGRRNSKLPPMQSANEWECSVHKCTYKLDFRFKTKEKVVERGFNAACTAAAMRKKYLFTHVLRFIELETKRNIMSTLKRWDPKTNSEVAYVWCIPYPIRTVMKAK